MDDERDPLIDFLILGCQTLIYCEKVNNDQPIKDGEIFEEGEKLWFEILAAAKGNRSGKAIICDKDQIIMVERFIRMAYKRLNLEE